MPNYYLAWIIGGGEIQYKVAMRHLGGIIHPTTFQMNELIASMGSVFLESKRAFYRHKNCELALFGAPFPSSNSPLVLLDGKIDNREELAMQLGHSFSSDEELLAAAYKTWGEEFITKCSGEFAIALFDPQKEILYLIRDRLGKKNLYWTMQGGYFLFSTELKGVLSTGVVPQTPSLSGLASYLYFGFIPQELSPVNDVNKLLPGYFLKVDLKGKYAIEQYWSLSHLFEKRETPSAGAFENVLESVVDQSLAFNNRVGMIHSYSQGHEAIEQLLSKKTRVHSYSIPRQEPSQAVDALVEMVWKLGEPLADPTFLNLGPLEKWAENEALSLYLDLGWEEMIAAEVPHHSKTYPLAYRLARLPSPLRKYFLLPLVDRIAPSFKWRILRNIEINRELMDYLSAIALFQGRERKTVSPALFPHFDPEIFIERFHRLSRVAPGHDMIFYFNAKTKIPDSLLLQHQKLLSSLTVRTPFLEESLLASAASGQFSPRAQHPTTPYLSDWCHSPYFRELFSLLPDGTLARQELISSKWIRNQLGYPHLVPRTFKKLWSILILEIWFRLYITEPIGRASTAMSVEDLLRS